ncbi:hypothetical protein [Brevundimonas lenta]|uniref:hypothetical protein n=1 Tax=Brevundimonas lenta TaxID=424796 RepID=UPI0031DF1C92
MIVGLVAALALQQLSPLWYGTGPDLANIVTGSLDVCGRIQGPANPMAPVATGGGSSGYARGIRYTTTDRPGHCELHAWDWRPQGDRIAQAAAAGLTGWAPGFSTGKWREPFANEFGPTVWTTFEQHDAEGRLIAVVRVIEPADGAVGEMSVTYEAVAP